MQKVIIILFVVLFLSTGCSTTGFIGLAKESYVKQIEQENAELKKELETVKADMKKVLKLAKEIEELEELTRDIESQLDELPEETLRELVKILQDYLDGNGEKNDAKRRVEDLVEEEQDNP